MGNFFSSPVCPVCQVNPSCPDSPGCPECQACTECQANQPCPSCPVNQPCPDCPGCLACKPGQVCPDIPACPSCPVCPPAPQTLSCPVCPPAPQTLICPAVPVCPVCPPATICPTCPTCPVCPICPPATVCPTCPVIINYKVLGIDSNDAIIDINNTNKQILLPSNNKIYNGLLNTPVSYISPLYGKPTFYWEAIKPIVIATNILYTRIINVGAILESSYYNALWNARYMIGIQNTTNTNTKPTKYIVLKLPINPNTHNSIFIQAITRDRWSSINMYVCNNITNVPVKKIFTNCNSSKDVTGNSSFLGPMNNVAQQGHHEWIEFSLSIDTINTYKTNNNEICVSINAGAGNHDDNIWMTGVAVVPNNYAVTTMRATILHWNNNSNVFTQAANGTWGLEGLTNHHNHWNEESMVILLENKVCKIHVPIVSKDQDLIFGIITHNATWYDTSPMIYVDNTLYYLSQLISGRYGFSLQGRGLYRYAKGIFITKDVINKIKKTDTEGIDYIEIIINQSKELIGLHIRGMYTEAVQEYIKQ